MFTIILVFRKVVIETKILEIMAKRSSEGTNPSDIKHVKRIGRLSYNRQDHLGRGSFASVFRGKYQATGKAEIDVAIKRIETIDFNEVEKVVLEKLEPHHNIIRYFCIEEDDDFRYFATELCVGTLDDILRATNIIGLIVYSFREIRQMMLQIAEGVGHLHNNKIVHRNIKPANILASFPDRARNRPPQMKLSGFGLCRVVERENSLTRCGSRGWMAPELSNKITPIVDEQAMLAVDIYSLGLVFAYSLSEGNQHPFGSGNLRDYRMDNREGMILTVHDFNQHGQVLFQLIRCMLSEYSYQRYTIKEVIEHPFFIEGFKKEYIDSFDVSKDYETLLSSLQMLKLDFTYEINRKDNNGQTPLMLLCCSNVDAGNERKRREYIEAFLNLPHVDGRVVNDMDNYGNTALSLLSENHNEDDLLDIVRLLIRRGANVNHKSWLNGYNALMILCTHYNHERLIDIVLLFIENGVDINATSTNDAWNVLHILCRYYSNDKLIEIIALLIKNGIDLNAVTIKDNWNAITFLCLYYTGEYMHEIIRLLIENGLDVNEKSINGLNALGWVCLFYYRNDLIDIIRMIINKDSPVINCMDKKTGYNPLIMLCSQEYARSGPSYLVDIIHLLIDSSIDVSHRSRDGWNALMFVCRYYRHANLIDIVRLLVHYGCEINCRAEDGSSAFLLFCRNEYLHHGICLDVIRLLIDLKADVSAMQIVDGENALIYLCKYHHKCDNLVEITRLILDHSTIDVNHKNKKGENDISILQSSGRFLTKDSETIVQLLTQRGLMTKK